MSKKSKVQEMEENQQGQNMEDTTVENNPETVGENEQQDAEASAEQQLHDELAKEKDKFLRLFAEFENFKKRTSKERMELFKTAGQEVMLALLPVLDDFDRALKEISTKQTDV